MSGRKILTVALVRFDSHHGEGVTALRPTRPWGSAGLKVCATCVVAVGASLKACATCVVAVWKSRLKACATPAFAVWGQAWRPALHAAAGPQLTC